MGDPGNTGANPGAPLRFGVVILAAGGSTRMGKPKQVLLLQGVPMVVRAVEAALASQAWPVAVVLGSAAAIVRPLLLRSPVQVVENSRWADGIGTSISAGIDILDRFSGSLDGALLVLADQPQISAQTINTLGAAFAGREHIVAARYSGILGAPVLFGRSYFEELLALPAREGAQRVLSTHRDVVTAVDLPECAVDLDTPDEFEKFLEAQNQRDPSGNERRSP